MQRDIFQSNWLKKNNMYIPKEEPIYMRYLNQGKGLSCNQIVRRFPQFRKAPVF